MHVQMRVVHEDVWPEGLRNDVDHRLMVEQAHEPPILAKERKEMQRRGGGAVSMTCRHIVDRLAKLFDERGIERAGQADVAVVVESGAYPCGPPRRCNGVHGRAPLCRCGA